MMAIHAERLYKKYEERTVFSDVSIEMEAGEHAALIGANGAGKTTLLRLLLGQEQPDGGTIRRDIPLLEWGYMEQRLEGKDRKQPLLDFVLSGTERLFALKIGISACLADMESAADNGRQEKALAEYGRMLEAYEAEDGYGWELNAEKRLHELRFEPAMWTQPIGSLSGGQQTRAQLARLSLRQPKVLLLDEPTNHLDQASLDWLADWLNGYLGTVLFVSHDRHFIDRTAHAVYALTGAGMKRYKGGYADFRWQREHEVLTQKALFRKQEQERKKLVEAIRRYKQWFQQATHGVKHVEAPIEKPFWAARTAKHMTRFKAKERALERLERDRAEKPRDPAGLHVRFDQSGFGARTLAQFDRVTLGYGGGPILSNFSFLIERGDRIAVIGPNGSGKTTLLKLLTGELTPEAGEVRLHPQLRIGYFAQQVAELNDDESIVGSLLRLPGMTLTEARTLLACFGFRREDADKRIDALSMGERCRVAFVLLYFSRADVLVLDEPTNYLDIEARESIERALEEYPGALVLVSHDRYLLRRAASRVVDLGASPPVDYPGTYAEYELRSSADEAGEDADLIRTLELRLAQAMAQEPSANEAEREALLRSIRQTRQELDRLRRD